MSPHLRSLTAVSFALAALVACGSDAPTVVDAGADLGADAGPRCVTGGEFRACQCPGGAGPAITLACATDATDDTCYTYATTCVDDGFSSCETLNFAAHPLLEARCRAYCAVDGGVPDTAPCSGW